MPQKRFFCLLLAISIIASVRFARAEITGEQVNESIRQGVKYLKDRQNKVNGSWTEITGYPGGVTALCTLALLNAGESTQDPQIQKALEYLRSLEPPTRTYVLSLQTMVLAAAEPKKSRLIIDRNVRMLESLQIKTGKNKGAWSYTGGATRGDNSNTQFALLALHEAHRAGVKADEQTWRLALSYWLKDQLPDGAWRYSDNMNASGSMTCAGIASVLIASEKIEQNAANVINGQVQCCGAAPENEAVERGLHWLGSKFSVNSNPTPVLGGRGNRGRYNLFYYLYALERVGRLSGQRFFDAHDWYREGAEMIVKNQDRTSGRWVGSVIPEDNPLLATSFSLLFLSKGRRQVVLGKFIHTGDWDLHPRGVARLTRRIEQSWRRDLTWQTIDAEAASLEDLLQTPILFISGRGALRFSPDQKAKLRQYVDQGGFIFVEACNGEGCDGEAFDRSFRTLMKELFPESSLRLLPPDHAVWFADKPVDPNYIRPLYGVDACCRTSIIYCPQNLSCFWSLSSESQASAYPEQVQNNIEACLRIGQNVVAYATGRRLKDKLDRPQLAVSQNAQPLERGILKIPKLSHGGGSDDAPNALANMLMAARNQIEFRLGSERLFLSPLDESLEEYPILFMHGRRDFQFSQIEREALARYIERGGFLMADAICASEPFMKAFRREMLEIFPDAVLTRIAADHPLFTKRFHGFDLSKVTLRQPQPRTGRERLEAKLTKTQPLLEGLEIDGRLAVVFSPYDLSCALESHATLECKGYVKEDAARIGVNLILYALQQ